MLVKYYWKATRTYESNWRILCICKHTYTHMCVYILLLFMSVVHLLFYLYFWIHTMNMIKWPTFIVAFKASLMVDELPIGMKNKVLDLIILLSEFYVSIAGEKHPREETGYYLISSGILQAQIFISQPYFKWIMKLNRSQRRNTGCRYCKIKIGLAIYNQHNWSIFLWICKSNLRT